MGMIDESIKKLKGQQADFNEQYIDYGGINDAFFTAYEVMRKYQKIEQIVANNDNDGIIGRLVRDMIEDGN